MRRHLAFGLGVHFCMGAPLARVETKIALRTLFDRFEKIEYAGGPQWTGMFLNHALKTLDVTMRPRVGVPAAV